ncbi:hypothetical protein Prum_074860 [Phytohabitans rumicis]|uniref:Uncharacterized protein n=1 Tax=Phytohabitans rumicis TaxID=1076125 RepID=A0A6V8LBW9_9ACTN|nr:glycoside hydrolase family 95 protein [Phytohabitans rumicis]GFJ93844.1 hypothetical protein Prum_074860 [Phytohabitans rumicis]
MARHRLQLATPAAAFHDGFPLGNGALGAMVHGRPGVERFDLNLDTLWSGGPLPAEQGPPPSRLLPSLRQTLRSGQFLDADVLARQMQGPGWTQSYQPIGWLDWRYAADGDVEGYRRELDVADAVATTSYRNAGGPVEVVSFVSAPAGVLVVSVTGAGARIDPVELPRFTSPHPSVEVAEQEAWLVATGRAPAHVLPNYVDREPAVVYADDVPSPDGTVAAGMGFALVVAVQRAGADEVRLIVGAASGFRGYDQRPSADLAAITERARGRVSAALATGTAELRMAHTTDYRGLFDRVDLDLSPSYGSAADDPARAEFFFHYGRYLLISSSRPGTEAANLQGIWNADVRPGWSCNYTTNINAQMNYWLAESTALQDLHQPLFDLARDLARAGAATAARYYAAAGSAVHHNTDIWRFSTPVVGDPQFANWPSGLLWLAGHLWDHIEYGAGEEFVRDTALPVLRAAAAFALDMLVADANGELVMSPSTSPEHHFLTGTGHAATSEGSTMDQELVREVLTRYTLLVDRLAPGEPGDNDLAARARAALALLRPPAVGTDGALLEWYDERPSREPGHRHVSHLYGLYPGVRITEAGTPRDFAAARRALRTRLDHGSGYTGWSQAWIPLPGRTAARRRARRGFDLYPAGQSQLRLDAGPASRRRPAQRLDLPDRWQLRRGRRPDRADRPEPRARDQPAQDTPGRLAQRRPARYPLPWRPRDRHRMGRRHARPRHRHCRKRRRHRRRGPGHHPTAGGDRRERPPHRRRSGPRRDRRTAAPALERHPAHPVPPRHVRTQQGTAGPLRNLRITDVESVHDRLVSGRAMRCSPSKCARRPWSASS